MNLDVAAMGVNCLHAINGRTAKKDKITLLSRQSSHESLDFQLLEHRLRQRMPGVEVSVHTSDPETVDKVQFAQSMLSMGKEVAESRVCIVDGYLPMVSIPKLDSETRVIQIWHALGAIKKFGYQCLDTSAGRTTNEAVKLHMHGNYDWIAAAGPGAVSAYASAFGYPENRILPIGLPRMDYLLDPSPDSPFKQAASRITANNPRLQAPCKRILYVPTLRKGPGTRGWMTKAVAALAGALAPYDAQLIVAGHPLDSGWDHNLVQRYENIVFISGERSCDLLGIADAVISDYSAIALESGLLGIPTYFYVSDIESYRVSPGLNVDPLEAFPACSFTRPQPLAAAVMRDDLKAGNEFLGFCEEYFKGVGYGATDRLCDLAEAAYRETKGGSRLDTAEIVPREAQVPTSTRSWAFDVYQSLLPLIRDKAFAFGDTCVGALFYQGYYPDMRELSIAMLRDDFDILRGPIAQLAKEAGWLVLGTTDNEQPYLTISRQLGAIQDPRSTISFYPMDWVPHQTTLRFKMLAEAQRIRPGDASAIEHLKRYKNSYTGVVARLCGDGSHGGAMGERTIQQRTIHVKSLFPLRSVPFEDGWIQLPRDVSCWASEPTPEREKVTAIIQQDGLESLEEIKRVCNEIGSRFFLVGGSLLGALRHQGYIPWDDDLDVGMMRADYNRFVSEAPGVLKPDFFVQLPSTDPHIHFVYARLRHDRIDYITLYNEHTDFDKGLWVDLFPFDAIPKNRQLAKLQAIAARSFARAAMGFKRRQEYVQQDIRDPRPLLEEDAVYLQRYAQFAQYFPVGLCNKAYHLAAEFFNPFLAGKPGTRYGSFIPTYTTIEEGEADRLELVPFEGHEMPVIQGSKHFLERQYGDFMSLPAPHQRQTDHGFLRLELPDGTCLGV
ncbi:MAG: LicD family protein [Eggerthellaceae bacterium]|jgi:phosphorylcholine metabolism protein LicD/CDP-glycerol glycerophosphotransferase (TagB/SpsB family)